MHWFIVIIEVRDPLIVRRLEELMYEVGARDMDEALTELLNFYGKYNRHEKALKVLVKLCRQCEGRVVDNAHEFITTRNYVKKAIGNINYDNILASIIIAKSICDVCREYSV